MSERDRDRGVLSGHDVWPVLSGWGECDECWCDSPALYRIECEDGCFPEDGGAWRYCGPCARKVMRAHDSHLGGEEDGMQVWDENPADAPVQAGWLRVDGREHPIGFWTEYGDGGRIGWALHHFNETPDGIVCVCTPADRCAECDPGSVLWSFYGPGRPRRSGWAETVEEARAEVEELLAS